MNNHLALEVLKKIEQCDSFVPLKESMPSREIQQPIYNGIRAGLQARRESQIW